MNEIRLHEELNIAYFESVQTMGGLCAASEKAWRVKPRDSMQFYNYMTYAEASRKAVMGDESGVQAARAVMERYAQRIALPHWEDLPSVAGAYACVPDALMGEPESMRMPELVPNENSRPLRIVVDLAVSRTIDTDTMRARGIAVLALVMALNTVRPVTLEVCSFTDGDDKPRPAAHGDNFSLVVTKINTQPLDMATAAYALTNAAFVRWLCFTVAKQFLGFDKMLPQWKGLERQRRDNTTPEAQEKCRQYLMLEPDDLFIPGMYGGNVELVTNPDAWIQRHLIKFAGMVSDQ